MSESLDLVIIGAGPAGLSAAASAARHNLNYILFEKAEIGNTIFNYQLRKHVMAEPPKLALRANINFEAGKREDVLKSWNDSVVSANIKVKKAEVKKINKEAGLFHIEYQGGKCTSQKVILAIGMQGTPRRLGCEGEDLPHVSYTLSDPDAFENQDIVVVGGGDAGIENALALIDKNRVTMINRGAEFARAKDANIAQILAAINSGKMQCFHEAAISKITETTATVTTPNADHEIKCSHMIIRAGCILPRPFLEGCGITFANKDPMTPPVVDDAYQSNVDGLYIIGALVGYPLIKQAINQGNEVVQHIIGEPIAPADQPLIEEKLQKLPGNVDVNLKIIRDSLPLFKDLSKPQFRELICESNVHLLEDNQIVFKRNDYTDTFFSVVEGAAIIELPSGKEVTIGAGEYFGEIGLISGRRRSATVRTKGKTILLEAPRKQMIKLMSSVESVKSEIDKNFALRSLQTSVFPTAEASSLQELVSKMKHRICKKGELIFSEGDVGSELYVVRKGSVQISRKNSKGEDIVQLYLAPTSIFGEMALLKDAQAKRSATVKAAVGCELLVIERKDALVFFEKNPTVKEAVQDLARERAVQNLLEQQESDRSEVLSFLFGQGISDAENVLVIDSNLCVSCDNCETACAATHNGYSRLDRKGGKSFASIQVPISCRHCENPLCMVDCPPDALARTANGEVIIRDSCIGCGNCVRNCPYGVIQLVYDKDWRAGLRARQNIGFSLLDLFGFSSKKEEKEKGPAKAAKCDLCEGQQGGPACVRACPTGAAIRINPSKLLQVLSR